MQIEIEIPVVTWGYPKGSQTQKLVLATVPKAFEIPEYTASDMTMPFAFTRKIRNEDEDEVPTRVERVEFYGLDGNLYRARGADAHGEQARSMAFNRFRLGEIHPFFSVIAAEVVERVNRVRNDSRALAARRIIPAEFAEHFDTYTRDEFTLPPLASLDLRDSHQANVESSIKSFSDRMERAILVDGKVLFREQEPVLEVSASFYSWTELKWRMRLRPETEPLLSSKSTKPIPIEFIPLSEYHNLPGRMQSLADRFGIQDIGRIEGDEILDLEINDASYLTGEAEAASLIAAARLLRDGYIEKLGRPYGSDDADAVRAKMVRMILGLDLADVDLAQRLITALDDGDPMAVAERLEPVMEDFAARAAVGGVRSFGEDAMIEHAVDAIERWHDREAGLSIAITPSIRA